ncbi:hypothetical protein BKA70DRAFT_1451506 [Coprinopsis sp. MPI-PUGE-AT-0042]|nr:hypothetical protein BKA70DRAFT_1451506 [Coprinopsis sp. MPI-PUGE-AT-0042]
MTTNSDADSSGTFVQAAWTWGNPGPEARAALHGWVSWADSEEAEALDHSTRQTPAHEIFTNSLVLGNIVMHGCWIYLVNLAAVSKAFREAAQVEARLRFFWALGEILEAFDIDPCYFMLVLECCGGSVVGTTAHRALMVGMQQKGEGADSDEIPTARRLSVMVPKGKRNLFRSLVDQQEKRQWTWVSGDWAAGGMYCLVGAQERTAEKNGKLYFLRVVETLGSVMLGLSNSSTTGDMIAFLHDRLYILYPDLTLNNLAIVRWTRREHMEATQENRPAHPKEQIPIQPWSDRCGVSCPAAWRKAREGSGIAQFFWNGHRERDIIEQVKIAKLLGQVSNCWRGAGLRTPCPTVLRIFETESLLETEATFKWRISDVCPNHMTHTMDS